MSFSLGWFPRFVRVTAVRISVYSFNTRNPVLFCQKRTAGHSHWQNVRHTKEANDKERVRITTVVLSQIDFAVKSGGGIKDPKVNNKLAAAIADAKAKNVPMDTINRRLLAQDITDPYIIEVQAPGGIFALIETRSKNIKPTRDKIQGIAKKYGFKVSKSNPGGIAAEFFDHLGVVSVPIQGALDNIDKATETAIECGAGDVQESEIDDGIQGFEFHCEVKEVDSVRENLQSRGITVYDAFSPYIPRETVEIPQESCKLVNEMYDRIRDTIDYADNFYDNCKPVSNK